MIVRTRVQPTPWLAQRILWSTVTALMLVGLPLAVVAVTMGWV